MVTVPLLFLLVLFYIAGTGTAFAEGKNEIKDSQTKIDTNREKIRELEERQKALEEELGDLKTRKSDTASFIDELDKKRKEMEVSAAVLSEQIRETEREIGIAGKNLEEAENLAGVQKKMMGLRIRYFYETSRTGSLEMLLQSGSLSELLSNAEYISRINEYDRRQLEEFRKLVRDTDEKKKALESAQELLNRQKKALEEQIAAAESLQNEKREQILAFEEQISSTDARSRELAGDVARLNAAIKEEEEHIARIEEELRKKEEEERRNAQNQQKEYRVQSIGDLTFIWPVPSSDRITSRFGDREAPVEGASTKHKGIDIGASSGEKILASESGTVVISTYSRSAGNYVMISHGGGIYTVYMHMEEAAVSENDSVTRGDVIGYVGSTGYSTGPHLHFGLRINGEYADPLDYVAP